MKATRPLLRYHGGKWLLAKWIITHFIAHRVYIEPFGGAASVLLQKPRSYAEIYNDMDEEVVNLFKVVRDNGIDLVELLNLTPFSRSEFEISYLPADTSLERARRTVIRSFMGFGSGLQSTQKTGFRANSNRSGSTPAKDWNNYPECLKAIIERMKGVIIENKDYKAIITQHDSHDALIYLDPPYCLDTRFKGQKTSVYRYELSDEQQIEMCQFIKTLSGHVILSGYNNPIYNDMLNGWDQVERRSYADGAKPRIEKLWIKPNKSLTLF